MTYTVNSKYVAWAARQLNSLWANHKLIKHLYNSLIRVLVMVIISNYHFINFIIFFNDPMVITKVLHAPSLHISINR